MNLDSLKFSGILRVFMAYTVHVVIRNILYTRETRNDESRILHLRITWFRRPSGYSVRVAGGSSRNQIRVATTCNALVKRSIDQWVSFFPLKISLSCAFSAPSVSPALSVCVCPISLPLAYCSLARSRVLHDSRVATSTASEKQGKQSGEKAKKHRAASSSDRLYACGLLCEAASSVFRPFEEVTFYLQEF